MTTTSGSSLFDPTEPDGGHTHTFINPILWFDDCDGYRVVFCRHEILYRVALDDPLLLALVAVTLRQSGLATQLDAAAADPDSGRPGGAPGGAYPSRRPSARGRAASQWGQPRRQHPHAALPPSSPNPSGPSGCPQCPGQRLHR